MLNVLNSTKACKLDNVFQMKNLKLRDTATRPRPYQLKRQSTFGNPNFPYLKIAKTA